MKNIPEKIYLQVDPENENTEDFNELQGVTWCKNKINETDVGYIRKDVVQHLIDKAWEGKL